MANFIIHVRLALHGLGNLFPHKHPIPHAKFVQQIFHRLLRNTECVRKVFVGNVFALRPEVRLEDFVNAPATFALALRPQPAESFLRDGFGPPEIEERFRRLRFERRHPIR